MTIDAARFCRSLRSGLVVAALPVPFALGLWGGPVAAQDEDASINEGGILFVHDHGPIDRGRPPFCDRLDLPSLAEAKFEMEIDDTPHLLGVYAAFAEADSVSLAGATFGIEYSAGVSVLDDGGCGTGGVEIKPPEWPASRQGMALGVFPRNDHLVPIYWFLVLASEKGWFELTPNPASDHGGVFGSAHAKPLLTPITGYGRLGIGAAGKLPEVGIPAARGICCLDRCAWLSPLECGWFSGLWLGSDTDCASEPCDEGGLPGACCLVDECVLRTRIDCINNGGRFSGEGSTCVGIDCIRDLEEKP